jgi:endoglucanase
MATAQLHTQGSAIVDAGDQAVHLTGVNWYGAESTDFVVGGLQHAALGDIVQQIKSRGFNVVRLPWSDQMVETDPPVGDYALTANPDLRGEHALQIYDRVVSALTGAGIMVILDNHNSDAEWCCKNDDGNGLWYNQNYSEARWIADWQMLAGRYRGNALVIGADLRNEPRNGASWGGDPATDWQAAATRAGDAVLSVNPHLLIFVEGTSYATDLSQAGAQPVVLNVPNRVVYEAHDYHIDHHGLTDYQSYQQDVNARWGYLLTGPTPLPLFIGEFGTCNTAPACIEGKAKDTGKWFHFLTRYLRENNLSWTYWALNGTQNSGAKRVFDKTESFGILNSDWNGDASGKLTTRLETIMAPAK